MSENEMLVNRDNMFPKAKYIIGNLKPNNLIVVEEDKAEETEVHWDGRLQRLRDYLDVTVDAQSNLP